MKILIDLTSLADNFSGIERFALSITQELIEETDMDFVLVFKNKIHEAFRDNRENVKKVVLQGKNKLWFNQVTLPLGILKIRADYYLFPAFPAPFFFFKKKSISAIHDISCWDCPQSNKKHMIAYFRVLYRKISLGKNPIITVSEFSKKRIMEVLHVKEDRLHVIYNGLSDKMLAYAKQSEKIIDDSSKEEIMEAVRNRYKLPEKYLLCLSTLEPRKNLPLLVQAYDDLYRNGKISQELVLAGRKGWMVEKLLECIDEESRKHIHFTGFVEDEDLPYVYEGASLFVFPSLYEGFGIPPIEAMSMGSIVVSSDAASMPEVLGDAAFYFENNQKNALETTIERVLSLSESQREKAIENGRKQAMKYTWKQSAKRLARVLRNE